jgi:hypothetical protein
MIGKLPTPGMERGLPKMRTLVRDFWTAFAGMEFNVEREV